MLSENTMRCCSQKGEKWKAKVKVQVKAEGERSEAQWEMSKVKVRNPCEHGKTSSERELYFFDNHSEATSGENPVLG